MRDLDGRIFLSATDLMRFMSCAHATTLDLAHMRGTGPAPGEDTEDAVTCAPSSLQLCAESLGLNLWR